MTNEESLDFWRLRLKQAQDSLSKRLKNGHVASFSQNGASMQYTDDDKLIKQIKYCENQIAYYKGKIEGKGREILRKGIFIR